MMIAFLGASKTLTQVSFGAAGAGASGATSVNVAYPTGIVAGSFLIVHAYADDGISTPSGWTVVGNVLTIGGSFTSAVFYKIADGTESGTLTVSGATGLGSGMVGRMYRLSHGSGVEATSEAEDTTSGATIAAQDVTTQGVKRLACQCIVYGNTTIAAITGETNADYTEAVAEYQNANGSLSFQVAEIATAVAITGGTAAFGVNSTGGVHGFAVKP